MSEDMKGKHKQRHTSPAAPPPAIEEAATRDDAAPSATTAEIAAQKAPQEVFVNQTSADRTRAAVAKAPKIAVQCAAFIEARWGVPSWLSLAVMATTTEYGATCPAPHNWFGLRASGTMRAAQNGYAWFPSVISAADQFGAHLAKTEPIKTALAEYGQRQDGEALCEAMRAYDPDIPAKLITHITGA